MMKLVSNWKNAWRWHSTQLLAIVAVAPFVWVELPPDIKALLPEEWRPWVFSVMAAAGIAARLKDQGGRDGR